MNKTLNFKQNWSKNPWNNIIDYLIFQNFLREHMTPFRLMKTLVSHALGLVKFGFPLIFVSTLIQNLSCPSHIQIPGWCLQDVHGQTAQALTTYFTPNKNTEFEEHKISSEPRWKMWQFLCMSQTTSSFNNMLCVPEWIFNNYRN